MTDYVGYETRDTWGNKTRSKWRLGRDRYTGSADFSRYRRLQDLNRWLSSGSRQSDLLSQLSQLLRQIKADVCGDGLPGDMAEDEDDRELNLWEIEYMLGNLEYAAEVLDEAHGLVAARLGGQKVLERIAKLRNAAGRTPAEAEAMSAAADRLERRLRETGEQS